MTKSQLTGRVFISVALGLVTGACSESNDDGSAGASGGAAAASGGSMASGGSASGSGGAASGGSQNATGGAESSGSGGAGASNNSGGSADPASGGAAPSSGGFTGTCTESEGTGRNVSGSGPHDVVVEINADDGINEGTIFRPADLGGTTKYPIFVWGEGGCSRNGLDNQAAMAQIASHGYFVVADGTPVNSEPNRDLGGGGDVLLAYIDWLIAENEKPCSAYYQSMDTSKIAANGFSCGGLMAAGTAADPRMTTWGHTSSGSFSVNQAFYDSIHTPVLIVTGTEDSLGADENGARDFENISKLGDIPVMMFAKIGADHGGDLWAQNGGEFTKVNLAWLNWWLKGDETATGKGMLVGSGCPFCSDSSWQVSSANLP